MNSDFIVKADGSRIKLSNPKLRGKSNAFWTVCTRLWKVPPGPQLAFIV